MGELIRLIYNMFLVEDIKNFFNRDSSTFSFKKANFYHTCRHDFAPRQEFLLDEFFVIKTFNLSFYLKLIQSFKDFFNFIVSPATTEYQPRFMDLS